MKLAVSWIRNTGSNCHGPVLICTDCRAITVGLLPATDDEDVEIRELRGLLDELRVEVRVQWVPGHAGLRGNEWADREVKVATTGVKGKGDDQRGGTFSSAKAMIRRTIRDPRLPMLAPEQCTRGNDRGNLSRKETVLVAQLRSGHCRKLAAYHKIIDDTVDLMCPQCGREPETVEHWLQRCPVSESRRIAEFGVATPPMTVLFPDPVVLLAFSRSY